MKNALLLISALLFSFSGYSQTVNDPDTESGLIRASFSAGLYSTKDIHTSIHYSQAGVWGRYSAANYFLDLHFYRYNTVEIGISLGYQQPQPKTDSPQFPDVYVNDNSLDVAYYTILPQVRFNWVKSDDGLFELYSGVGLGLTIVDVDRHPHLPQPGNTTPRPDETYPLPAFHINWLGMRFGDKFGGFLDMGLGTKGLMAAGISYRL